VTERTLDGVNRHRAGAVAQHPAKRGGLDAVLRFNPSLVYGSERYAYNEIDSEETPVLNRFDPYTLANLYVSYDFFPVQGLTLGVGAYDVFNNKEPILQAYNGDFAPISGRSREITLKLSYDLSFKK
jgi:hypothetical protein